MDGAPFVLRRGSPPRGLERIHVRTCGTAGAFRTKASPRFAGKAMGPSFVSPIESLEAGSPAAACNRSPLAALGAEGEFGMTAIARPERVSRSVPQEGLRHPNDGASLADASRAGSECGGLFRRRPLGAAR